MPTFKWSELKQEPIDPQHSPANGAIYRGTKIAVRRWIYPAGSQVKSHANAHEQIHSILKGRARYRVGGEETVVGRGEAVLIRPNVEHSIQVLEATEVIGFQDVMPAASPKQAPAQGAAFFKWDEMKSDFITPEYSSGRGPVVSGERIEVAFMFYPGGTEAKPHSHPNEQIQVGLNGKAKYIIGREEHVVGPEGGVLMPVNLEHSVHILEDYTVINCKDIVPGFSVYHARWEK
jgi:quercetin dioxygenase-like cupin family protein